MSTGRQQTSGLTRVDLLVVLMLVAFLLAAAGPLASKPREQDGRMFCGANLGRIGRAMLVYASDYEGALPRAGGPTSMWGALDGFWSAPDRYTAYGLTPSTGEGGRASISSCFYLLVKYLEMPPGSFVCPGDIGTSRFKLADEDVPGTFVLADAWDFGATSYDNCSYAYHMPFSSAALNTARDSNLAVAADRNPWIRSPMAEVDVTAFSEFVPDTPVYGGRIWDARRGNAYTHQGDGQNVLFLDGRVTFEHRSFCGVRDERFLWEVDNIYTRSSMPASADSVGHMPVVGTVDEPANEKDSLLVHDPPSFGTTRRR